MIVTIQTIRHDKQRYDTAGDWLVTMNRLTAHQPSLNLDVRISSMQNWRHEALVAIHELIEALLCHHAGISQQAVDEFDMAHPDAPEPGDLADAPYRHQHAIASGIERLLAAELGVDWLEYEQAIEAL